MSSKAAFCSTCGYSENEVTEEQLDVMRARRLRDKIYQLSMVSYSVITVFIGGFGWYWWASGGFEQGASSGPFILMGLSAMAYLVVRAMLLRHRLKLKALRRKNLREWNGRD